MGDLGTLARKVARTRAAAKAARREFIDELAAAGDEANVKALADLATLPRSSVYNLLGRLQDNENTTPKGPA